ncbi:holo-ACP synthase [Marinigracilibium pacificum]|uniref:Holo-[acyl-carrier-protein] synthase n=1 Tax=Marinigracilibium pacificum TaxID=2729599 RepID=A0A848IW10_9BACT|nr:holo-ACP synthase [Marinigracilibium pacificum]NMM47876.1 holo-ACP synthase [Marinigracilibium pacificum]
MIIGIGTDIIEIERVQRSLDKGDKFQNLVYHPDEIKICENNSNTVSSYSGRFAAKEAFLKALGTGWSGNMKISEIIIKNDSKGKPYIEVEGEVRNIVNQMDVRNIHLSISHSKMYATAFVILEK